MNRQRRHSYATAAIVSMLWLLIIGATGTCGLVAVSPTIKLRGGYLSFSRSLPLAKPAVACGMRHSFPVRRSFAPVSQRRNASRLRLASGEEIGSFYMLLAEGGIVAAMAGATTMLVSILAYSLLVISQGQQRSEPGRNNGLQQQDEGKPEFLTQQKRAKSLTLLALVSAHLHLIPIQHV